MTRSALCIARCFSPRATIELAGVCHCLSYCDVTMVECDRSGLFWLRARARDDRYFVHTGRSAVQLHAEVDERPYGGSGLKALATSKKHVALMPVAGRVSRSRGVRGNRHAALPLARGGRSTT